MNKYSSRIISLILCALVCCTALIAATGCSSEDSDEPPIIIDDREPDYENMTLDYGLTQNIKDGAVLHTWSWSFNTIKESMSNIAAAGFSAVQTSPVNECYVNESCGTELYGDGRWYYHYQPTDWVIGNYQLGTRDEFKSMCDEAHKYGIKVIVDVVPNHTATDTSKVSQALINAAGGFDKLYHKNGFKDITNWGNRLECTSGAMGGLPDVNTENKGFQDYFINFLNDCIECGADGFRYDTAKHIALSDDPKADSSLENNFWQRVTTEIKDADRIFNYGEVLQGDNDRCADYADVIGATTASNYGAKIRNAVKSGTLTASSYSDYLVSGKTDLVTWFESHDNYINDGTSSFTEEDVKLGWALICSRKNTTPLFFDRPYGSSPSNTWGTINLSGAAGSPFYLDRSVVYVNRFRNANVGVDEKLSNPDGNTSLVMTERVGSGAVIVNLANSTQSVSGEVSLPDGEYSDYVSGNSFNVSGGKITGSMEARSVSIISAKDLLYTDDASPATFKDYTRKFSTDTVYAELDAGNVFSAYYSINGSENLPFTSGDKLVLGNNADKNGQTAVTLTTYNFSGIKCVMTYYFTKSSSVADGTKVYFNKPSGWGDKIYAYVYDDSGTSVKENSPWPGIEMTKEADGRYSYTFKGEYSYTTDEKYYFMLEGSWDHALIIFNDGTRQVPAAMEPGYTVVPDKTY